MPLIEYASKPPHPGRISIPLTQALQQHEARGGVAYGRKPVDGGYPAARFNLGDLQLNAPMRVNPLAAGGMQSEIVTLAVPQDERVWVPQAPDVWFRPLMLNTVSGGWFNLLRVRKSGVLSRHRHPMAVYGYVIKGRWRYLEHDWVAEEGGFVYEPPGEVHTLIVDEPVEEMITLFNVNGAMIYVDEKGETVGYEDVFTKIEMCRKHYEAVGLGADYVNQFMR
jgi:2,4'-dihydroxyacetophenone dioxygenase